MVITVTGATGLIGSALVRLLSEAGVPVRAVTRDATRAEPLPGVAWMQADLEDPRLLEQVLAGTDRLFLLTANQSGFAELQIRVVETARSLGTRHIVKLSALGASGRSKSGIGLDHWRVEQEVKDAAADGTTWTILRPHTFMQNWLGEVAQTVRAEGRIYSPVGDGRVPFIDARDIAAVAATVLRHPEAHVDRTYVLTGAEAVGFADVASAIADATGRPVEYCPISPEEAAERMRERGMRESTISALLALAAYQRAGGPTAEVSDAVEEILGRPPRDVRSFARDYREQFLG
jgi:uncharacterized protein YbjT (DUF2867 family)